MPRKPLFESAPMQRLVIAALMIGVFVASLGLASVLSARHSLAQQAAPPQAQQLTFTPTQVAGLRISVPDAWARDADTEQALGLEAGQVYRDSTRDGRAILIAPLRRPVPTQPIQVLGEALDGLLTPVEKQTLQPVAPQIQFTRGDLSGAQVIAVSQAEGGVAHQEHHAAALTIDGLTHWVIYMTDRAAPGEDLPDLLKQNTLLFRTVLESAMPDRPA